MRQIVFLNESILDPINKTRCREIFDENDQMHPQVKEYIESTFNKWYEELDDAKKTFEIVCYKMIGSASGFQYTETSDVDIQVYARMKDDSDLTPTSKALFKILPNGNVLPDTNHPVNYFLVDNNNPVPDSRVENRYDLTTGIWEKKSSARAVGIPTQYIREVSQFFIDGIDLAIGRFDRSKAYLEDVVKLNPEKQEISEKEKAEAVTNAKNQFSAAIDSLRIAAQLLYGFLLDAYNDSNFFHVTINYMTDDDPRYSMNNLIYKTLDRFEYRHRLWEKIGEGREYLKELKKKGLI